MKILILIRREEVRNSILGYPSLKNKNFGTFLGEIHRINPEKLGYPRIPGYPLTSSLVSYTLIRINNCIFHMKRLPFFRWQRRPQENLDLKSILEY